MRGGGLDSSCIGQSSVVGCCEHGTETLGSIKRYRISWL